MNEQEFLQIWLDQKTDSNVIEYRLYYDDSGFPLFYSTQDLPGNYITIDKQTYSDTPKHIRIIDGKIKIYKTTIAKKLTPAQQGQACDPRDICVPVPISQPHELWIMKQEEQTND